MIGGIEIVHLCELKPPELRKGQNLRLQVSATGEVTWQATSEKSKLKNSTAAAFLAERGWESNDWMQRIGR
eukprot:s1411_g1.t1